MSNISENKEKTITGLIEFVFKETKIPVSTLKLNANILKTLGLIEFFNGDPARLTGFGKFITSFLAQNGVKASTVGCKLSFLEKSLSKKQTPAGSCSIQDSGTSNFKEAIL